MALYTLSANFQSSPRRVTKNGQDYTVATVSLIVPGVLNGNNGPLLYQEEDVKKSAASWNGVPVTMNHPRKGGNLVGVRQAPQHTIGVLSNSRFEGGKLKADAWIDSRASEVIQPLLDRGKLEVSTGLYTENQPASGSFKGRPYSFIARNYVPDHLAILPDMVGACSIQDGCGLNVNQKGCRCGNPDSCTCKGGKPMASTLNEDQRKSLIANLTEEDNGIWEQDDAALLETFTDNKLLKLRQQQLAANNLSKGYKSSSSMRKKDKEENEEGMPKMRVVKDDEGKGAFNEEGDEQQRQKPTANMSAEEYYEFAPPEIKEILKSAHRTYNERKAAQVDKLVSVANVSAEEKDRLVENLGKKSVEELETMVEWFAKPKVEDNPFSVNYFGQQGAYQPAPTSELTAKDREDYLPPPEMNFEKEEVA